MTLGKIIKVDEERAPFQLLFLKDDKTKRIEVEEIDLGEIKEHLKQGESVLIISNRKQKLNVDHIATESAEEPWYFTRV